MSKVKSFQLFIIAIFILILFPVMGQPNLKNINRQHDNLKNSDVITMDIKDTQTSSKMEAVDFPHSIHKNALNGRCDRCHILKKDSFEFKLKGTDKTSTKEQYHNICITCHIDTKKNKEKAGPLTAECRACHTTRKTDKKDPGMAWQKIYFNKSLHFIHVSSKSIKPPLASESDNCSACHHKLNEKTKKLYHAKGEEESCRYCHKDKQEKNIPSLKSASHNSCVACHKSLDNKKISAGPVTCAGCHDPGEQLKIKQVKNIPRLKRGQPGNTIITGAMINSRPGKYIMNPVAFNHESHESKNSSCTSCHHNSLKKCNECHTPTGNKDGSFITLENAMHDKKSDKSCMGCHTTVTRQPECAGCHSSMPEKELKDHDCTVCHNTEAVLVPGDGKLKNALAEQIMKNQSEGYSLVLKQDIPEKVIIDRLSDKYMPCEFPHRKVVMAIAEKVEKSSLAKTFHKDQKTLCMGCHHNGEKSSLQAFTPPKCSSCHAGKSDIAGDRPGLKGAFHGQCITCHEKMKVQQVKATDCVKCHKQK